jgi:hypothetical protein
MHGLGVSYGRTILIKFESLALSHYIEIERWDGLAPGVAAPRIKISIINSNKNNYHRDSEHI